ncbi:MAG: carbohydrate ABC transporter permease, partial [Rhodospirillales bacterium]|nr:carbohydrate ABC transporter permease [Rhodospirillales bacterium]
MAKKEEIAGGMDYLVTLPKKVVNVYIPLFVFLIVLLFPFYWMVLTTFKPNPELYDMENFNPCWVAEPTLDHIRKLFAETHFPDWFWTTMIVSVGSTFLSLFASVTAAYAIQRLRFRGSDLIGASI